MSASFRKTPSGTIEVNVVEDNAPVLVARSFRIAADGRVDLALWVEPTRVDSWIALRNPRIPMLNNSPDPGCFRFEHDEGFGRSEPAYYAGVVLMRIQGIQHSSEPDAHLVNLEGAVLAGSNTYPSDGRLCLGEAYNALTFQPAELLLHNTANNDLSWAGPALLGTRDADHLFHITTWPILRHLSPPPAAILADIARWWPT